VRSTTGVDLVERAGRRDEHQEPTGAHRVQRLCKEIVVQKKGVFGIGRIGLDRDISKGRVADRQIVGVGRNGCLREIVLPDAEARIE